MLTILKYSMRRNVHQMANRTCIAKYCCDNQNQEQQQQTDNTESSIEEVMERISTFSEAKPALLAIELLAGMAKTKNVTYNILKEYEHFEWLQFWLRNSSRETPMNVMATLTNMEILKYPSDCSEVKNFENALLLYISTANLEYLLNIYNFFLQREESESKTKKLEVIRQKIEEKGSQIRDMSKILFVYKNWSDFSSSLLSSLDEIVIQYCETLDSKSLTSLLVALAASKRRNPTLLYAATQNLHKCQDEMSPKQIINVFYAMDQLNYYYTELMVKLADEFNGKIDTIDRPTPISAMLYSCKQSRYRHEKLLDTLSTWIEKNADKCRVRDFSSYLLTLATVNYVPNNFDNVLKIILPVLRKELEKEPVQWLNCVWSLVVLNKAEKYLVESTVTKSFYDYLPKPVESASIYLKLLNIISAAKILKYGNDDILDQEIVSEIVTQLKKVNPIQSTICVRILENFLSSGKVAANLLTDLGIPIGAEFILDARKNSLLLENYEHDTPLPKGGHKIAAMFWSFKHYCYASRDLTGDASLAKYLLKNNGYSVLEISYDDLDKDNSAVRNVAMVNDKIKELYS